MLENRRRWAVGWRGPSRVGCPESSSVPVGDKSGKGAVGGGWPSSARDLGGHRSTHGGWVLSDCLRITGFVLLSVCLPQIPRLPRFFSGYLNGDTRVFWLLLFLSCPTWGGGGRARGGCLRCLPACRGEATTNNTLLLLKKTINTS